MSQELLYTSAPNGLKPGSRGFCTVLSTQGMPAPLATAVESLSGYRPVFSPSDERARQNPVVFAHLKLQAAGKSWHVLSRVSDYALDYSGRPNKLAHHVIIDKSSERLSAGPAALLAQPGFMRTDWQGEPKVVALKPVTREPEERTGVCTNWQAATGDAGWAGVIAESFLANPDRLVIVLFEPGQSVLPLFEEAISLLPPDKRWNVTFSTYFTGLLPGTTCNWRGILSDTKEATDSKRFVDALRIDLNQPPPFPQVAGELVEAARTGIRSNLSRISAGASTPLQDVEDHEVHFQEAQDFSEQSVPASFKPARVIPGLPQRAQSPPKITTKGNVISKRLRIAVCLVPLVVFTSLYFAYSSLIRPANTGKSNDLAETAENTDPSILQTPAEGKVEIAQGENVPPNSGSDAQADKGGIASETQPQPSESEAHAQMADASEVSGEGSVAKNEGGQTAAPNVAGNGATKPDTVKPKDEDGEGDKKLEGTENNEQVIYAPVIGVKQTISLHSFKTKIDKIDDLADALVAAASTSNNNNMRNPHGKNQVNQAAAQLPYLRLYAPSWKELKILKCEAEKQPPEKERRLRQLKVEEGRNSTKVAFSVLRMDSLKDPEILFELVKSKDNSASKANLEMCAVEVFSGQSQIGKLEATALKRVVFYDPPAVTAARNQLVDGIQFSISTLNKPGDLDPMIRSIKFEVAVEYRNESIAIEPLALSRSHTTGALQCEVLMQKVVDDVKADCERCGSKKYQPKLRIRQLSSSSRDEGAKHVQFEVRIVSDEGDISWAKSSKKAIDDGTRQIDEFAKYKVAVLTQMPEFNSARSKCREVIKEIVEQHVDESPIIDDTVFNSLAMNLAEKIDEEAFDANTKQQAVSLRDYVEKLPSRLKEAREKFLAFQRVESKIQTSRLCTLRASMPLVEVKEGTKEEKAKQEKMSGLKQIEMVLIDFKADSASKENSPAKVTQ